MAAELHIRFDGNQSALKHHRLSIAELGRALPKLLRALRRSATAVLKGSAISGASGRQSDDAKRLDLELAQIDDGCVQLRFVCTEAAPPVGKTASLISMAPQAVERLVHDLQCAHDGEMLDSAAMSFLDDVHCAVQEYRAVVDGIVVASARVQRVERKTVVDSLPRLRSHTGTIAGIRFDSGIVRVKAGRHILKMAASDELVECAIGLRKQRVTATTLERENERRLLRLDLASEEIDVPMGQLASELAKRWDVTLRELAK